MSSFVEFAVVDVTVGDAVNDLGADVAKRMPSWTRYRYYREATYTLSEAELSPVKCGA